MPKIPEADFGPNRVSTNVGETPVQSIQSAGRVEDAWSGALGSVSQLANQLASKRAEAAEKDYINTESTNYSNFITDKDFELKKQYAANPSGYAKAKKDITDKYFVEAKKRAPTDNALKTLDQNASKFSSDQYARDFAWENDEMSKIGKVNTGKRIDSLLGDILKDPSSAADKTNQALKNNKDALGVYYNGAEASLNEQEIFDKAGVMLATSALNAESNPLVHLKRAKLDLEGKNPDTAFIQANMSAESRVKAINNINDGIKKYTDQYKIEVKNKVENTIAKLGAGLDVPADEIAFAAKNAPKELRATAERANAFNEEFNKAVKTGDLSKIREAATVGFEVPETSQSYAADVKLQEGFRKLAKSRLEKIDKAPGEHIYNSNTEINNLYDQSLDLENLSTLRPAIEKTIAAKEQSGITSSGVLPYSTLENWTTQFKMAESGEAKAQFFARIESGSGKEYASGIKYEMVSYGDKKGVQFSDFLISGMASKSSQATLFDLKNMKEGDLPSYETNEATTRSYLDENDTYKSYREAIKHSGVYNDSEIIEMDNLIILQSRSKKSAGSEAAINEAVTDFIGKVEIVEAGSSKVIIPNEYSEKAELVEDLLHNDEFLGSIIPNEEKRSSSQWILAPSRDKLVLIGTDDKGRTGPWKKDGKRVEINLNDVESVSAKYPNEGRISKYNRAFEGWKKTIVSNLPLYPGKK